MTVTGATAPPSSGRFSAQLLPLLRLRPTAASPRRPRLQERPRPAAPRLPRPSVRRARAAVRLFDGLDQEAKATERRRGGGKEGGGGGGGKPPTASPVARLRLRAAHPTCCDACGHTSTPADESCSHLSLTPPPPTADERPPPPLPRAPFASPASGKHDDPYSFPADDDAPAPAPKMPKLSRRGEAQLGILGKAEADGVGPAELPTSARGWTCRCCFRRCRRSPPPPSPPLTAFSTPQIAAPAGAAAAAGRRRRLAGRGGTRRRRRSAAANRAFRAKPSARRAPTRARAG